MLNKQAGMSTFLAKPDVAYLGIAPDHSHTVVLYIPRPIPSILTQIPLSLLFFFSPPGVTMSSMKLPGNSLSIEPTPAVLFIHHY